MAAHDCNAGLCRHDWQRLKDPKITSQKIGQPVPRVHTDFSGKSAPMRLKAKLPDEAEQLSNSRYAIIQVHCLHDPECMQAWLVRCSYGPACAALMYCATFHLLLGGAHTCRTAQLFTAGQIFQCESS